MDARDRPLAGIGVLVTRPAHQAENLARLIEADGGRALRFPTIEIAAPLDPAALYNVIDRLGEFAVAVFVSPNAVEHALRIIRERNRAFAAGALIAAVGAGTARALGRFGIEDAVVPERFTSEALLDLPALARVGGKRVVIFRGDGGRELLAETLTARGARVEYAECYRRVRPPVDVPALLRAWAEGGIDIVSITSSQGLRNLYELLGAAGRDRLRRTPVVVVSAQQAATGRELGLVLAPIVARAPVDEAILEAIRTWRAKQISL